LISDFTHDWEMWYRPDGGIEYLSPSFQDITGYAPLELMAHPSIIDSIIYPEDLSIYKDYIKNSLNFMGTKQSLRFRILTRTKQMSWCEIKCRAVYDKRGKYLGQRATIGDITSLMKALGQIKDLSEGKRYDLMAKQKYRKDLENKDRELVGFLMELSHKNEILQITRRKIDLFIKSSTDKTNTEQLLTLRDQVHGALKTSESWDTFKKHFEQINPGFFERLKIAFPNLSPGDLKLCGYLRLGLSTKEISILQNITFQSTEISRVRLRKKLGLSREINLPDYINNI
ncbi:MAG: PAS domain-containing protein, partial [Bacteroidales bacterium]|nr:PAS domain-containing protein [Bacteroidales bacterium]